MKVTRSAEIHVLIWIVLRSFLLTGEDFLLPSPLLALVLTEGLGRGEGGISTLVLRQEQWEGTKKRRSGTGELGEIVLISPQAPAACECGSIFLAQKRAHLRGVLELGNST